MAVYRNIQISFWQDPFVLELSPEEKYFYIYLMTNSKTTQCGIYQVSKKIICLETGYDTDVIDRLISSFEQHGKIKYSHETHEIFLVNWIKHNPINNVNIEKRVAKELNEIKNKGLVSKFFEVNKGLTRGLQGACFIESRGLDTPTKKKEEEEEREKEREEEVKGLTTTDPFISLLNSFCSLHGRLDIHVKVKERELMQELTSEIPIDFILDSMNKIHGERSKETNITSFLYYKQPIKEAWKIAVENGELEARRSIKRAEERKRDEPMVYDISDELKESMGI